MSNSIIDEVRAARAVLAEEHRFDREKILDWARKKQAELNSKPPNKVQVGTVRKSSDEVGQNAAAPAH